MKSVSVASVFCFSHIVCIYPVFNLKMMSFWLFIGVTTMRSVYGCGRGVWLLPVFKFACSDTRRVGAGPRADWLTRSDLRECLRARVRRNNISTAEKNQAENLPSSQELWLSQLQMMSSHRWWAQKKTVWKMLTVRENESHCFKNLSGESVGLWLINTIHKRCLQSITVFHVSLRQEKKAWVMMTLLSLD